ncbi:MAG: hypothetical protein ABEJ43_10510 [Haloferacaceae archaeon]
MVPSRQHLRSVVLFAAAVAFVAASLAAVPPADAQSAEGSAAVAVSNVTASTQTPTAGEPFSLRVTIVNYEGSEQAANLNQVVVSVDGERRYVAEDLGRLTPGSRTTVTVPLTLDDPGQRTVDIQVYGISNRGLVNTRAPFVVDVREPQRPSLSVSVPDAVTGASRDVNVTLANGGDGPIGNVVLRADSPADAVSFDETTRVRGRLPAGETRTFSFPARVSDAGRYPVELSLTYTENGRRQTVNETFETRFARPSNPGQVILSGVETTRRGGTVELSATASNVGGTSVGGVVVAVNGTEAVRPQTYFVGSIDASGFSSFSLQTRVTGNVSTLPVEVRYVTGGVERSFTTEVTVPAASGPATPPDAGGGGSPFGTVALAVGGLALVVGGVVVYRRRR